MSAPITGIEPLRAGNRRLRRALGALRRDRRGVSAVEFALVAPALLYLMFAILEIGLVMHVSSLLENAVHEAGRLGSTGNSYGDLNPNNLNREDFVRKVVADRLGGWLDDPTKLQIAATVVGEIDRFGNVSAVDPDAVDLGAGGSAVLYEVTFRWDIMTPLAGPILAEDGALPLRASAPIINEDFCGRRSCSAG